MRRIPAGTTTSYGALAASISRPSAMRAVGLAVGSNPVAVIVPCHRVIGADHSLTGYGGGLGRKRWLLAHEGLELSGGRVRQRQERAQPQPTATIACSAPAMSWSESENPDRSQTQFYASGFDIREMRLHELTAPQDCINS